MKQLIIIAAILMMSGIALAHDPNELPVGKQWQASVNSEYIITIDYRMTAEEQKVYRRGGIYKAIIAKSVMREIHRQVVAYWQKRRDNIPWEEL